MTLKRATVQCVILAGGLATRMRPVTEKVPKAMISVLEGKPFAELQVDWLARHGVTDIVFSIGYKGEMIRKFIGDGSRWNLNIKYVDEGNNLLGTAGALRKAFDEGVLEDKFLVTYGDSFLPIDFGKVFVAFRKTASSALMTVFRNDERFDRSNACYDNGRVTLYDKTIQNKPPEMKFIDYGLSALTRETVFKEILAGRRSDLSDLFHRLSICNQLAGYEVDQRFYEIGSPSGLADFRSFLAQSNS